MRGAGLELRAVLLQLVKACFCVGFAGVGVFLVLRGFPSWRELPHSWCVEAVKGAQAEEMLSCSSPLLWSDICCLSWRRSPAEPLRFSPMKGGFSQAIYVLFFLTGVIATSSVVLLCAQQKGAALV